CAIPFQFRRDGDNVASDSQWFADGISWRPQTSNGSAPSINSKLCPVNETGTIRGQEDNGFGNLVRCSRTVRRSLGGQLLKGLAHSLCAFGACRPRADGIDPDTARPIFSGPRFSQQVQGGLARPIEAHAGHPVISDHRGYIDYRPFASLCP